MGQRRRARQRPNLHETVMTATTLPVASEHHGSTRPGSSEPLRLVAGSKSRKATRIDEFSQDMCCPELSPIPDLTDEEARAGMLTEEAIRIASGNARLRDVTRLKLVVDTSETSVEGAWSAVPRLHTLTLDGSRLVSFRDLGVDLQRLNTLSLESSEVADLDGIVALAGLRNLRLADNRVADVTPLACHGNLQVLGLAGNRVSQVNALDILGTLPALCSLDLRRNPLAESLGQIPNRKGRAVVHNLVPQIRVLDGLPLSNENTRVDAGTLEQALDLIGQGACRARAAWAVEVGESAALSNGESEDGPQRTIGMPLETYAPRLATGQAGGFPSPDDLTDKAARGIASWDSELTQGGAQAFSGKPSSAIRRHKLDRDSCRTRTQASPTRVLDTLDLARSLELDAKHRHTDSARMVSEWRRETCLDTLNSQHSQDFGDEGDSAMIKADSCVRSRGSQHLPEDARYHCCSSVIALGAVHHKIGNRAQVDGRGRSESSCSQKLASQLARTDCSPAMDDEVVHRDSLRRPWTTGGLDESVRLTEANLPRRGIDEQTLPHTPGFSRTKQSERRAHRRTRVEAAIGTSGTSHAGEERGAPKWQPLWASLQTAHLVSPRVDEPGYAAGNSKVERVRFVDFSGQRRARIARIVRDCAGDKRGADREIYRSSSDGAESSDGSEGAIDRGHIKERASNFASVAAARQGDAARPAQGSSSLSKQQGDDDRRAGGQRESVTRRRARGRCLPRRSNAAKITTSPLAFSTMDDSTSDRTSDSTKRCGDEGDGLPRGTGVKDHGRHVGVGSCGEASQRSDANEDSNSTGASSAHASRRLGFDLRKSLAAIDEWTDRATSARDGYVTPHHGATPGGKLISSYVHDAKSVRGSSPLAASTVPATNQGGGARRRPSTTSIVGHPVETRGAHAGREPHADSGEIDAGSDGDTHSEDEAVMSVAEARAALGISKARPSSSGRGSDDKVPLSHPAVSKASLSNQSRGARRPSVAEIDAIDEDKRVGGRASAKLNAVAKGPHKAWQKGSDPRSPAMPGKALRMTDEALESMLRRQPRTVPELRTKESFREFFRGMKAERMGRLLRGAYEGTLPLEEAERKVRKRLGLVGDNLAW